MAWLNYAKTASILEGKFLADDEKGLSWIFDWKRSDILSQNLSDFKKDLSDLAAEKISRSELAFLRANPEAAASELFLRACQPMLNNGVGNADWCTIQETIRAAVKQFYLADITKFGSEMIKPLLNDVYFSSTARLQGEKETMGFLLFSITPALPFGVVKVINFFTREDNPDENLRNNLMGLIFKILPQTKRLFLFTRPTDLAALAIYAAMGFERDKNPFEDPHHKINHQYLTALGYRVENSNILQPCY